MATSRKSKIIERIDLGIFDAHNQRVLVKSFIINPDFFKDNFSLLESEYFTDKGSEVIMSKIIEYYNKTHRVIDMQTLKVEIDYIDTQEELAAALEAFNEMSWNNNTQQMEAIKEHGIDILKCLKIKRLTNEMISRLNVNGYDVQTYSDFMDGMKAINGKTSKEWQTGKSLVELSEKIRNVEKVPIGIDVIDKHFKGGMNKRHVGMLIAGTGAGKTTLTCDMIVHSALKGAKVLHYVFEEEEDEIAEKYRLSIGGSIECIADNIVLKRMPNGTTTVEDLENNMRAVIASGFAPDLIVIDYLSCLLPSSNKMVVYQNEWQAFERCVKKIEQISHELNCAILICQQCNRDGVKEDEEDLTAHIQGSFRAVQPCAVVMSLTRKSSIDYNDVVIHLGKCRYAERDISWRGNLDYKNCHITMGEKTKIEDIEFLN